MNNLQLLLMCIVTLVVTSLSAQDIHFSQFNMSPLNLNPALTGAINGDVRVVANYRNQWSQVLRGDAYNTYALSVDGRKELNSGDYLGWGITGYRDVAGELSFGTTQGNLSAAYSKLILEKDSSAHYLVSGGQFGIARRSVDLTNARWPSQHDGNGGFDPNAPIDDNFGFNPDFLHMDLNLGLMWMSTFRNSNSLHFGIASYHLNKPNISFYGDDSIESLTIRTTIHGGGEIALMAPLSIAPSFSYMRQGPHRQLNVGSYLRLNDNCYSDLMFLQAGMFYRTGKNVENETDGSALILACSAKFKELLLSFAYEFTLNELGQINAPIGIPEPSELFAFNGALELTVGFIIGARNPTKTRLPKIY